MKKFCTVFVLGLFFTTQLPFTALATHIATTTDGVDITLTVTEAAVGTPTPPPSTGGGGPPGTPLTIQIIDVTTEAGTSTATISWETNKPALSTFSWGTTTEYALGTISGVMLVSEQQVFLDDLVPETQYFFRIEADDKTTGKQAYVGTWTTLPISVPDIVPPANITNFVAVPGEDYIDLSWTNPPDLDFTQVRIVRSETFYPEHPFDGKVVYEGSGEFVRDTDVIPGVTYYYAAFARDEVTYSEGSITQGRLIVAGVPPEIVPPFEEFPSVPVPPELKDLSLLDFDFIQDGKEIAHLGLTVPIDGSKDLTISTDYKGLPEVLKTIAFTLVDPEDRSKTFSFLLRVTDEKDTFRTTIAPLLRGGTYEMFINILDHKNQKLRKIEGELLTTAAVISAPPSGGILEMVAARISCLALLITLLVVSLLLTLWNLIRAGIHVKNTICFLMLFTALSYLAFFRGTFVEKHSCTIFLLLVLTLICYGFYVLVRRVIFGGKKKEERPEWTEESSHT